MKVDARATKVARDRHSAGVKRLHELFAYDASERHDRQTGHSTEPPDYHALDQQRVTERVRRRLRARRRSKLARRSRKRNGS